MANTIYVPVRIPDMLMAELQSMSPDASRSKLVIRAIEEFVHREPLKKQRADNVTVSSASSVHSANCRCWRCK